MTTVWFSVCLFFTVCLFLCLFYCLSVCLCANVSVVAQTCLLVPGVQPQLQHQCRTQVSLVCAQRVEAVPLWGLWQAVCLPRAMEGASARAQRGETLRMHRLQASLQVWTDFKCVDRHQMRLILQRQ